MFAHLIIVCASLRNAIFKQLQSGNPGINHMKIIENSVVYWLNLDVEIEHLVKTGIHCMVTNLMTC